MTVPRRLLALRSATPLFDATATRAIEQRAAATLPPHELMRRAGAALARLATAIAPHARTAWIAAGPGNNGGDGLVLAALLKERGLDVRVTLVGHAPRRALPPDAAWALQAARDAGVAISDALPADADVAALTSFDLCVDALLGVGHARPPQGDLAAAVTALDACRAVTLAIDLPTGLATDTGAALGEHIVHADHTLALLTAKPGLVTGSGLDACGELWLDDLGVAATDDDAPVATLIAQTDVAALYPHRRHDANKGRFGDVHVAGGAAGMVGASLLAGHAASLAGAGRVLVHAHASDDGGALPVAVRHPELMLRPVDALQPAIEKNDKATVVAGCGGGDEAADALPGLLAHAARLVLDADALNAIARDASLRARLRERAARGQPTILTPHPLEAARLLGSSARDVQADRLDAARRLAADTGAVVALKGSGTVVARPDGRLALNPTGDARLSTAGTGDVLAGWIGGTWSAQGPMAAGPDAIAQAARVAAAAAFVHGRSCDLAPGARLPLVAGELAAAVARAVDALRD